MSVREMTAIVTAVALTVVAALVWRFIFESPGGLATAAAVHAGLAPPTWFADPSAAWVPIVLADAWKTTPFVALLLLAARRSIPEDLYRAAQIDGASPLRALFSITIPLLRPAIAAAAILRTLDAFRVFDAIYVLTAGGPANTTETLAIYTYKTLMDAGDFGYGSTLAFATFLCVLAVSVVYLRLIPREARP